MALQIQHTFKGIDLPNAYARIQMFNGSLVWNGDIKFYDVSVFVNIYASKEVATEHNYISQEHFTFEFPAEDAFSNDLIGKLYGLVKEKFPNSINV